MQNDEVKDARYFTVILNGEMKEPSAARWFAHIRIPPVIF
jgi:hypothetical protein